MMSTSRNPRVVTRAVRPPLRSRMALVATVVAIRIWPTSARRNARTEASRSMPSRVARAGSEGVLRVFANHESPLASSRRTKSVKVPPVSIASRSMGRRPALCRFRCLAHSRLHPRLGLGPGALRECGILKRTTSPERGLPAREGPKAPIVHAGTMPAPPGGPRSPTARGRNLSLVRIQSSRFRFHLSFGARFRPRFRPRLHPRPQLPPRFYRPVNFGRSLARNARNPIWKSSVS